MPHLETLAVHAGRTPDPTTGAVSPGLVTSTTFERGADGSFPEGFTYTRADNPNRRALEAALAALEGGAVALAFSSGQAATAALLQSLSAGDHVLLGEDLYHGTRYLVQDVLARWGLRADFIDLRDLDLVARSFRPETKLLWAETPSNPQLRIADLRALAGLARERGVCFAVDNTWATPLLQRPLELGAEVVMHSTTKYFGGHSDVLGGALITREDGPLAASLRNIQKLSGAVPSPFDCWLLQRSLPTLPVRLRAQCASASRLAEFLATQPLVTAVHYPGLTSHPGHAIAQGQMSSPGAMLSFEVRGGAEAAMQVAARLRLITRATSLGGVESTIEHRASIEGPASITPPGLLRLSVGLEHVDDLLEDLRRALTP